ncbi:MAG TPA: hypothetical protein VGE74_23520 [Gemmata sp.]
MPEGSTATERPKSFADRLVKSGRLVYLVRGRDKDRPAWYYILLDRRKVTLFLGRLKADGGPLQLLDYGTVLASGWGENPPDDVKKRINSEYP